MYFNTEEIDKLSSIDIAKYNLFDQILKLLNGCVKDDSVFVKKTLGNTSSNLDASFYTKKDIIDSTDSSYYIFRNKDGIISSIIAVRYFKENNESCSSAYIVYTLPEFRRQGQAKKLFEKYINDDKLAKRTMYLNVLNGNEVAYKFYLSLGYKPFSQLMVLTK
jgi:ribosomal protein S18 acetylase RimI-like enzyme